MKRISRQERLEAEEKNVTFACDTETMHASLARCGDLSSNGEWPGGPNLVGMLRLLDLFHKLRNTSLIEPLNQMFDQLDYNRVCTLPLFNNLKSASEAKSLLKILVDRFALVPCNNYSFDSRLGLFLNMYNTFVRDSPQVADLEDLETKVKVIGEC